MENKNYSVTKKKEEKKHEWIANGREQNVGCRCSVVSFSLVLEKPFFVLNLWKWIVLVLFLQQSHNLTAVPQVSPNPYKLLFLLMPPAHRIHHAFDFTPFFYVHVCISNLWRVYPGPRRRSAMSLPPYLLGPNPWATMMAQQQLAAAQQAAMQAHAVAAANAPPVPTPPQLKPHHITEEKIKEKGEFSNT